jgi:predicted esterase
MMPHQDQPILQRGPSPDRASAALIMLHGRGASAESIFDLAEVLDTDGVSIYAPQAEGSVWYPVSFLEARERNQQGIDGAFAVINKLLHTVEAGGISRERVMFLGFSQGACLASDFLYRSPSRYGAAFILSGGLIGPQGTIWEATDGLEGTPVFIGCSDQDPFIPAERVRETYETLRAAGADAEMQLYPGMPHTVIEDEVSRINRVIATVRGERGVRGDA